MSEIKFSDFIGRTLKDMYHVTEEERKDDKGEGTHLVLEFNNNYKIELRGVGKPGFKLRKDRMRELTEDEIELAKQEKKAALRERHEKESKQKNRPKKKK